MTRIKIGVLCMAVILMVSLFSGCSSNNSGSSSDNNRAGGTQEKASPEKTTLRFSWWGGEDRHAATLAAIEAYKQIAPNVTIEAEYQGFDGYEQKIKTQLAGKTSADILQLDLPWLQELAKKGDFFVNLKDQPEFDVSGLDQEFLNNYSVYDDKLIAIPTGVNAYCMIINKTLADQLGIPTDVEWDWETLYEVGKKLHEQDSSKYLMLTDHAAIRQDIITMLKQRTGSQWVTEDYEVGFQQEDAAASFNWLHKAMEAGVYQPLGESDLFFGKIDQNPKWINQEIPMAPSMSSILLSLKNVLPAGVEMVTSLPVIAKDAKDSGVLVRPSQLLAISNDSKNKEESVKFLNWFMNDKEAAVILGDVRSVPPVKSSQEAAVAAGKIDVAITNAVKLGLSNAGVVDNSVANNSEVLKIMDDIVQKVSYGKSTPEEAADELISSLTSKLQDLKNR